jgi:DNA-binding transcriptional LysR family regulator
VPYEYHIGVDYHKSYSHLVVQDSGGKTLRSGRVKNDRQSVASFLDRYKDNSHAVVEATHNWMVMYDWLDDICEDVVLAHPLKVKAIADAKIKTDKIDATVLAHLLRADPIKVDAFAPVCSPRLAIAGLEDIRRVALIHVDGRTAPLPLPDWPRWCSEAGINGVNTTVGLRMQAAIAGQGVAIVSLVLAADALAPGLLIQSFRQILPGDTYHFVCAPAIGSRNDVETLRQWFQQELSVM